MGVWVKGLGEAKRKAEAAAKVGVDARVCVCVWMYMCTDGWRDGWMHVWMYMYWGGGGKEGRWSALCDLGLDRSTRSVVGLPPGPVLISLCLLNQHMQSLCIPD